MQIKNDVVSHLHGLQHQQRVASLHLVTNIHGDYRFVLDNITLLLTVS